MSQDDKIQDATIKDLLVKASAVAMNRATEELERSGSFGVIVIGIESDGAINIMPDSSMFNSMMNSPQMKTIFFTAIRQWAHKNNWIGAVICTDGWHGKATEDGLKMMKQDAKAFMKLQGELGIPAMAERGLMICTERIIVTAQSEAGSLITTTEYKRDKKGKRITLLERVQDEFGPGGFGGKQQIYGKPFTVPE